ncbi:hypothetical protein BSKO_01417 [Bryopsis sp. KO-2023]|nr:hypothetical protein BSKO_01417 [Bryopsis sp. KO-2023]
MRHDRETLCVEAGPTPEKVSEEQAYTAALERQAVADWIEGETGLVVPSRTDFVFRSALKDGVILCQLINAVQPPESDKVIHIAQNEGGKENDRNIESFLGALTDLKFPAQDTFSITDLTAPLNETHPKVANSLLKLKDHVDGCQRNPFKVKQLPPPAVAEGLEGDFSPKAPSMGITKMMEYWTTLLRQRILTRGTESEAAGPHPEGVPTEVLERFSGMLDSIMVRMEAESCTAVAQEREQRIAELEATLEDLKSRSGSGASTSRTSRTSRTDGDSNKENRGEKEMETLWREIQSEREAGSALERRLQQEKRLRGLLDDEIGVVRQGLLKLSEYVDKARPIEEENRKLYDTMLTLKGKLRVVCRLIGDAREDAGLFFGSQGEIAVASKEGKRKLYKLDSVLPPGVSDIRAFEEAKPLVRSVMDGFSACVVSCSGLGCSGKGSMLGDNGIVRNTLCEALDIRTSRQGEATYKISVQMAWVSEGKTFDLLSEGEEHIPTDAPSTSIRSFSSEELVSTEEVEEVVNVGLQNSNSLSSGDLMVTVSVQGVCLGASEEFCSFFHMINLPAIESGGDSRWFKREALLLMESLLCGIALGNVKPQLFRGHALGQLLKGSCPSGIKGLLMVHVGISGEDRSNLVEALKLGARVAQSREPQNSEGAKIMEMEGTLTTLQTQCVVKDEEISRLRKEAEEFRMEKEKTAADSSAIKREIEQLKARLRRSRQQGSQSDSEGDTECSEAKELVLRTGLPSPNSSSAPSGCDPCSSPHSSESPTRVPRKRSFGPERKVMTKSCPASKFGPGLSKLAKPESKKEPLRKGTSRLAESKLHGSLASKKERYKKSAAVGK